MKSSKRLDPIILTTTKHKFFSNIVQNDCMPNIEIDELTLWAAYEINRFNCRHLPSS